MYEHRMFANIKKIVVCHFKREFGCVDTKISSTLNKKSYSCDYIIINRFNKADSFRFTIKDSRINIYIEWVHPNSEEIYTTRLKIFNGNFY